MPQPTAETVAVVAFDGISPFHLSVPCMVFGEDRTEAGAPRFRVQVCAPEPGELRTNAGFSLVVPHGLGRADLHAKTRRAGVGAVFAEHHAGHGEVEGADAVEGDHGNGLGDGFNGR